MCLNPINLDGRQVSCGKCAECLLSQELTLGFRGVANIGKYQNLASITLSYDDKHVPLIFNGIRTFKDDEGQYFATLFDYRDKFASSWDLPSEYNLREVWLERPSRGLNKVPVVWLQEPSFNLQSLLSDEWSHHLSDQKFSPAECLGIFPAGDIKHLQSWFKKFREYYKRIFGHSPDIAYSAVLEYGPETCRPHFHIALFFNDIDYNFIYRMCQQDSCNYNGHKMTGWKYGSINSCKIRNITASPDDAVRIAKYVAKYAKKSDKGKHLFEKLGLVPTFRRCVSTGFNDASRDLAKELICRDLQNDDRFQRWSKIAGEYVELDKAREFVSDGLIEMAEVISRRLDDHYNLFGSSYKIKVPPCVLREALSAQTIKLYYDSQSLEEGHLIYREVSVASILWYSVAYVKACDNYTDDMRSLLNFIKSRPRDENMDEVIFEYSDLQKSIRDNKNATYEIRDFGRYGEPSWLD